MPALDADPQRIRQPGTRLQQVRGAAVDLLVLAVPQQVSAVFVQKDHALRQHVDGFAQPPFRTRHGRQGGVERLRLCFAF